MNSKITYSIANPDLVSFFTVNSENGKVTNSKTFDNIEDPRFFDIAIAAQNSYSELKLITEGKLYINLIFDENRMVLVLNGQSVDQVQSKVMDFRKILQTQSGKIIIIEKVANRRFFTDGDEKTETSATDIHFVALSPSTFKILKREDDKDLQSLMTSTSVDTLNLNLDENKYGIVDEIRPPFAAALVGALKGKTYNNYEEGPWIALIILAALIIICCIIAIFVLCFSYGRYKQYVRIEKNAYMRSLDSTNANGSTIDLLYNEDIDFLKQNNHAYETQSLALYVATDEPIQELGEMDMNLRMDDSRSHHGTVVDDGFTSIQHKTSGTISAVNPIYESTHNFSTRISNGVSNGGTANMYSGQDNYGHQYDDSQNFSGTVHNGGTANSYSNQNDGQYDYSQNFSSKIYNGGTTNMFSNLDNDNSYSSTAKTKVIDRKYEKRYNQGSQTAAAAAYEINDSSTFY